MFWKIASPDIGIVKELAHTLKISGVLARLLVNRGVASPHAAHKFLHCQFEHLEDPFLMKGLSEAVERILTGVQRQERVLVYGDYDVDGTTAVVIMRKALQMLGLTASYHIPRRFIDGYGMKVDVIKRAALEGVTLIISVDTGIRAFDVIEQASALGIDCIITDHHLPEIDLPKAFAILNPKRTDCSYPDKNLSGVGVAFKLIQALFMKAGKEKYLASFLKIVAIGTIADAVPLVGENRVFTKIGLQGLRMPANFGLKSLIQVSGLASRPITSSDVGFRLAPRINAVGRMGGGEQVIELFASSSEEKSRTLAQEMDRLNRERQVIEEKVLREIRGRFQSDPELLAKPIVVIDGNGWHRGVLGILATKISNQYRRPVLVIAQDEGVGHGSGRSPQGFNLLQALESCRDLFERFGGHAQAVGFQIQPSHIPELTWRLNKYASSILPEKGLDDVLEIDAEVRLSDINGSLLCEMDRLSPFGKGNPHPIFAATGVSIVGEPRLLKGKHLKFRVEQDGTAVDAIAWGCAETYPFQFWNDQKLSLAFVPTSSDYQGLHCLQLTVKDLRVLQDKQPQKSA